MVKIGKIPGTMTSVEYRARMTVEMAFNAADLNVKGCEIQKNMQKVGLDDLVSDGDTILAITRVRGNS